MSELARMGVIGARGWLGGAIVAAILDAGYRRPEDLTLSYRNRQPEGPAGAHWTTDNQELVDRSDVVIVSVRPEDFPALRLSAEGKLVISVMAGVPLDQLESHLGAARVVRSMPNAAASVRASYTPWYPGEACTADDRALVSTLFRVCGVADEVGSEGQLDYFAALTGTGPAYHALLADTLRRDAIARGIAPDVAARATTTLLLGSAKLMEHDGRPVSDVVAEFIDYAGMTAAALQSMRDAPLSAVVGRGIDAALERARSLQNTS
ncbi:pyrroline-5-carboxylate reductase dimerization domain-containing protein [Shinella sp. S4-D37]|uniref:pyrroline-5-carboxylate reductase family protein n=1 Tax=Shinella sp. S4-D37 TaxID=3161999 RepID=UPI003466F04B